MVTSTPRTKTPQGPKSILKRVKIDRSVTRRPEVEVVSSGVEILEKIDSKRAKKVEVAKAAV